MSIGVATTTPVAFLFEGELFLERMSAISEEGAGILSDISPPVRTVIPLAFKLSTSSVTIRCQARVLAHQPTTPGALKAKGRKAARSTMGAAIGDSATAVFRMGDLEAKRAPKVPAVATGFALRFEKMSSEDLSLVKEHVAFSQRLSKKLAARGDSLVSTGEADDSIGAMFDEGDVRKKAMDW